MPKTQFQRGLIDWYQRHKRELPWRSINDPYKIWLSEVILQQTRVAQGMPYYNRFVSNYPSVAHLAEADEDQVLKDWEGLGYYSRARNLHEASKQIVAGYKGRFPEDYEEILKLKGVGEYTAAAISSFAFNKKYPVIDGNVFRVLSRFRGIDVPINTTAGKKKFREVASEMLDEEEPATYNQAIMEFGALQCVPKNPHCQSCPLIAGCEAYIQGRVHQLPVKQRKKYNRQRYFHYAILHSNGQIYLEQRRGKDIWKGLYQFFLLEAPQELEFAEFLKETSGIIGSANLDLEKTHILPPHKLSHQTLHIKLFELRLSDGLELTSSSSGKWVKQDELGNFAFPKPLRAFMDRKN